MNTYSVDKLSVETVRISQAMLNQVRKYLATKPIKKAYLFGSYARGEATPESDVDILAELDETKTVGMIEFIKIMDDLEDILKRKIDLVTTDGLSPHIKPFIDAEKIVIYEA